MGHNHSTTMKLLYTYVLERGRIVETGRHSDLVEQRGLYYAMWRQQIGERRGLESGAAVGTGRLAPAEAR
jgi:ATP-binding cassette subfamily B protein